MQVTSQIFGIILFSCLWLMSFIVVSNAAQPPLGPIKGSPQEITMTYLTALSERILTRRWIGYPMFSDAENRCGKERLAKIDTPDAFRLMLTVKTHWPSQGAGSAPMRRECVPVYWRPTKDRSVGVIVFPRVGGCQHLRSALEKRDYLLDLSPYAVHNNTITRHGLMLRQGRFVPDFGDQDASGNFKADRPPAPFPWVVEQIDRFKVTALHDRSEYCELNIRVL
jgi:hypothetical protein